MTVPATSRRAGPFLGNGSTKAFPFTFKTTGATEVQVVKLVSGIETTLVKDSDYTVTLNVDQDATPGGTITYPIVGGPLATGETLTIAGRVPYSQDTDLPTGGKYAAQVVENALDRNVLQIQQLAEENGRSLRLPLSSASASTKLPAPEANKFIGWNKTADALQNIDPITLATVVAFGTANYLDTTGDGVTKVFTLPSNPGALANLDVAVGGVTQRPVADYNWGGGTTLTFTSAPANGATVFARYLQALPQGTSDAGATTFSYAAGYGAGTIGKWLKDLALAAGSTFVGYSASGAGAVTRTVSDKFRDIVSVEDFGAVGDGSMSAAAMVAALQAAFDSATGANPHDLYFPPGTYDTGAWSFPFRNTSSASLLDCKNLTINCSGPGTVFKTTSVNGADVLQLNALKNFHVRGFPTITGSVSGSVSGTNGVSITNGFDNITLQVHANNLPSLDKTTYVDGGKALTLQNGATGNACGVLRAEVIADGCCEGFGVEPDLVGSLTKNTQVDVHVLARNCYIGVKHVAAGASGALSTSMCSGIRVRGSVADCQHAVLIQRAHGIDVDVQIKSTKTAAQKRLRPAGSAWITTDTVVEGVYVGYAKNSRVEVRGDVGDCDYKARIGGVSAGSSGLNGATEACDITLDLGGVAAIADLLSLDSGGSSTRLCRLNVSGVTTAAALPADFTSAVNANRILWGANYTGSATLTLTGCTTSPTGIITYSLNGDVVTVNLPNITGTSNNTAASLTGLPAEIQPLGPRVVIGRTVNNGADTISLMDITGSVITLYNGASFTFLGSGTKGQGLCSIAYKR